MKIQKKIGGGGGGFGWGGGGFGPRGGEDVNREVKLL